MNYSGLLNDTPIDSIVLFIITFLLSVFFACAGKFVFKRKKFNDDLGDDDAKIILGAILSLLGLLIGFVLSVSISGYNNRQQTEENEAMAIGSAYQRIQILDGQQKNDSINLLGEYLNSRIEFFKSGVSNENNQWRLVSLEKQSKLWEIGVQEAKAAPNPVMASVLASFNELYLSEQQTMASWRHQIPNAAWFLLVFIGFFCCLFQYINRLQHAKS